MRKPRVLFVAGLTPVATGGAGGQLTEALTLYESGLGAAIDLLPLSTTMTSVPPPPAWRRAIRAFFRLGAFIRRLRGVECVLIYSADGGSLIEKALMATLARLGGKGVVLRPGSGHLVAQAERSPWLRAFVRLALTNAHVICAQGPFWVEYFGRYPEARGKIQLVLNGLRLPPFEPAQQSKGVPRSIVFVGWVQKEKGIFDLLRAFEQVLPHHQVRLLVVGGGRDFDELKGAVSVSSASGKVQLTGWLPRSEVLRLVAEGSVFALPSYAEGLPNALLESMALGTPVIASRVGSIPDVVQDGKSGLLVNPGDIIALTRALEAVLADPAAAERMAREARRCVEKNHDIETIWPQFEAAIWRAMNDRRRIGRAGVMA